ncbi:MAG: multidrug efflux SMR transporter [Hydrogenophilaceae bacterium]|nr:multidrug efflux SMR transporter [Hydrogenophilaceae bacterium]
MHWWSLVLAGLFEIAWAMGFKFAFKNDHVVSAFTIAAMIASFWFLWFAMREIPVGTAYAVWTGIGAAGAAILGVLLFKEPATGARILCIALILAGVAGLKLSATD